MFSYALIALLSAPAQAACPAGAEPIPPALSAWDAGVPATASMADAGAPTITLGRTAAVMLHPSGHVRLLSPPRRAADGTSHAGYLAIDVTKPGTYRVALSDRAWIEVLKDGKPVASTTHGHGPRCSGMRKIVDFPLTKGRHILQISGNPASAGKVLVVAG